MHLWRTFLIEGGKQLVNFMKFLQNMKSKGWDKNLILANQKSFQSSISTDLEPDYYITTLESAKENLILDEAGKNSWVPLKYQILC